MTQSLEQAMMACMEDRFGPADVVVGVFNSEAVVFVAAGVSGVDMEFETAMCAWLNDATYRGHRWEGMFAGYQAFRPDLDGGTVSGHVIDMAVFPHAAHTYGFAKRRTLVDDDGTLSHSDFPAETEGYPQWLS